MILTNKILEDGMSSKGAWSEAQLNCLGTTTKNNSGWKSKIIGKDFAPEDIDKFLQLRNQHLKSSDVEKIETTAKTLWTIFIYLWFGGKLKVEDF